MAGRFDEAMTPVVVTTSRRINAERLVLFGWSRAILLQLAHPLIAEGVGAHSSFRQGPIAATTRLHGTVRAMLDLTFGDVDRRARTVAGIRAIHDRVHGVLPTAVGPFPAGTRYSAHDPNLLLWVHVTLVESVVLAYDALVGPLDPSDRDSYCAESAPVAVELGASPSAVPRTWAALGDTVTAIERSGVLVVGAEARRLAKTVLAPPLSVAIWPIAAMNRQLTIGTLPAGIRAQYGFSWSSARHARFERAARSVRAARRAMPRVVALWADARH